MISFQIRPTMFRFSTVVFAFIALALQTASCHAATPWLATSAFEETFDYTAVDETGRSHVFKVRYAGLLNHYKYQTGNARFPDNRRCHYGFSKQIRRSFLPSTGAEFDPRLLDKVNQAQIYTPNLWGSAAVDLIDFIGQATYGAPSPLVKPLVFLDKAIVQNIAYGVGLKSGPNCGELANTIRAEFDVLMNTLKVARPIAEIDHLVMILELQGNYWIKPEGSSEQRRIRFIYPNDMKEKLRPLLAPLIDQAWAVNMQSGVPAEVRTRWIARIGQPNWQQLMWEEFGLGGLELLRTRVTTDKLELPRLIAEADQALGATGACTSSGSSATMAVGPFLIKAADVASRCGAGCLPNSMPPGKAKADIESLGRALEGRLFLLDADLTRLQNIEEIAEFSGAATTVAQTIRQDAAKLRSDVAAAKTRLLPAPPSAPGETAKNSPTLLQFLACMGTLQAERERRCAAGPCF